MRQELSPAQIPHARATRSCLGTFVVVMLGELLALSGWAQGCGSAPPESAVPGQGDHLLAGVLLTLFHRRPPLPPIPGTTFSSSLPEGASSTTRERSAGWRTTWTTQVSGP